ncbi:MAG: SRPBCC family protein [Ignavibacteria bacterium]
MAEDQHIKRGKEVILRRTLDAPRELVYKVWTNPEHAGQWWGPDGFTTTTEKMEVKAGGEWIYTMHGPDGRDYPNRIKFIEVVKPERLVYIHSGDNDIVSFNVEVLFADEDGKTVITMHSVFETEEILEELNKEYHVFEGAKQHIGNLEKYLAKMQS